MTSKWPTKHFLTVWKLGMVMVIIGRSASVLYFLYSRYLHETEACHMKRLSRDPRHLLSHKRGAPDILRVANLFHRHDWWPMCTISWDSTAGRLIYGVRNSVRVSFFGFDWWCWRPFLLIIQHWFRSWLRVAISQTIYPNACSRTKMYGLEISLRFELTIFQHWFR